MDKKEKEKNVETEDKTVIKEESNNNTNDKKKPNMKSVAIYGGIAAVLVVIIIILSTLGGGGARGVAQKYADAYKDLNAQAVVELLPEELVKYSKEQDVDLAEALEEEFKSLKDEDIKIKSVTVEESKTLSKDEINDAKYKIELYQIKVDDVTDVEIFTIKMTAENKDGDTKDADAKISVLKVNGEWKLLPFEI